MRWKVVFKPKPRCLRDKLELWFIGLDSGRFFFFNLGYLFPFIGLPVGLLLGLIITFAIDGNLGVGWHEPVRYVPVVAGPSGGVLIGYLIAGAIISTHYENNSPFDINRETIDRIIAESSFKPFRKRSRNRRPFVDDNDHE